MKAIVNDLYLFFKQTSYPSFVRSEELWHYFWQNNFYSFLFFFFFSIVVPFMSLFRKERVSFSEKGTRAACVFVDVGFVVLLFPHIVFDHFSTHENHPLICLFEGLDKTDAD